MAYGFGTDGEQMFAVEVGAVVNSSPALGPDGTLYLGTEAGSFVAIGLG